MRHFRSILIPAVLFLLPGYASAGWVQQQSGTTAGLHSIYFINPQTGWVAGDSGFILKTTDSGTHWERYSVDASINRCLCIRFWDSSLGFLSVSLRSGTWGIYKSTDGGLTWRYISQSFSDPPWEIAFVTPLKGCLVGYMLASGDGARGTVYQTTDGGESWVQRIHGSYAFRDVAFADSLYGWVTADNHAIFLASSGCIKQTTDGGFTWQNADSGGTAFGALHFVDSNYAWRSWRYFYPPSIDQWGIEKTTDRGAHWTNLYQGGGYWMPRISVPDPRSGWILLTDSLMATSDGGASWSKQVPPGSYKWDVCFVDSLNGWLVGDQGLILHTTDGGSGVWTESSRLAPYDSPLKITPNPFVSFATVPGHSSDRFTLYDVSGRRVGVYQGDRIGEGLRAGVYFLRDEGGEARPVRVVKVR